MNIRILCNQTDCKHCKTGWVDSFLLRYMGEHMYDHTCKNPDGVIIGTTEGQVVCLSKEIKTVEDEHKDIVKELEIEIQDDC